MPTAQLRLPPTLAHLRHEDQPQQCVATVTRPGDLLYRDGGWALVVSVVDYRFRRGLRLDEDGNVAADASGADLRDSNEVVLTAHADWECGFPAGSPGSWLISHLTGDELVTLRRRIDD